MNDPAKSQWENRSKNWNRVIVRPVANYGMPNYLRVTIGLPVENQRFLDALKQVLARV